MSPTETKESATKREIQVEIPAEEVTRQIESLIQKYQKLARLPGFRIGRVPPSIIRQRFSEQIKTEVAEALVPRFFRQETERLGARPIAPPRISDLHLSEGEPMRFKAAFEVLPEIKLEGYKELRAERPDITVTDADVEQALSEVREQHCTYRPIEGRALADGDVAQVSLDGHPLSAEGQPVHLDVVMVEIGGKNTVPQFSEHLRHANVGDVRTFEVTYPEDAHDKRLAGKTFNYTLKVQAIKEKVLSELNDEFAKELGEEFATLDDVRKNIRGHLETDRRLEAERASKKKVIDELIRRNDFAVPETLIENQIDVRVERGLRALAAKGLTAEQMKKMDLRSLRDGQREDAIYDVKSAVLLEKVAEEENIKVSDEELDQEVESLAQQAQQTVEAVRARLTRDGGLDRIRTRIRNEKTLDFLYQQSA